MDLKAQCIADIEAVARAEYSPGAISECMSKLDERLRGYAGGPRLLEYIERLLKAGNAERAARLLTDTPLRRVDLWVWLAVGAAGIATGVLVLAFGVGGSGPPPPEPAAVATAPDRPWPPPDMTALQDLAGGFVGDLAARRFADAHARLAAPYRLQFTPETLAASARNPYLRPDAVAELRRVRLTDGTAQGEGTLNTGAGSVTLLVDASLEDGVWKLTGLRLGGGEVLRQP